MGNLSNVYIYIYIYIYIQIYVYIYICIYIYIQIYLYIHIFEKKYTYYICTYMDSNIFQYPICGCAAPLDVLLAFFLESTAMQQFKQPIPEPSRDTVVARDEDKHDKPQAPTKRCSSYKQAWDKLSEHAIFFGFHCKFQADPEHEPTFCDFNASQFKLCHATHCTKILQLDPRIFAEAFIKAELCPHCGRRRRIWWRSILEPKRHSQSWSRRVSGKAFCSTIKSMLSCKWCLKLTSILNSEPPGACWTKAGVPC